MKPKLRAVPTVKPPLFAFNASLMYPDSEHLQTRYVAAIAWLRRGRISKWIMDQGPAKWRAEERA